MSIACPDCGHRLCECESTYNPDHASPPGHTIAMVLKDRGIGHGQFAKLMQLTGAEVEALLDGELPITDEMGSRLDAVLTVPKRFWASREARYRKRLSQGIPKL